MLALLAEGAEDISITRSRLTWAIPFPIASGGGETQGTWVWFDALPNYLTATGYPDKSWRDRWPADLHVIGKDITRLHAIVWPAMLQAAEMPLPRRVWAHGFVNFAGERFSKSAGAKLDVGEAAARYGPDAFRYFLMREVPFDADGNFSWERFDERYNADLANALGNLASRSIAMVERYRGAVVPALNLRARFGFERAPYDTRTRLLVVQAAGRTVGLVVDSAREFQSIAESAIAAPGAGLSGLSGAYLRGIATIGDRLIMVLDLDGLLGAQDLEAAAAVASRSSQELQ